jgi:hypothetical protein
MVVLGTRRALGRDRRARSRQIGDWLAPIVLASIAGCGGGGPSDPPTLSLQATLMAQGTLIACDSPQPVRAQLSRSVDGQTFNQQVDCPMQVALSGDYKLSSWKVAPLPLVERGGRVLGQAFATTLLPSPVLLRDGDSVLVIGDSSLSRIGGQAPVL